MPVTDDAIDRLKEMIRSGVVGPGDRLPREPDLAEALGVSRNSLREAVRALSLLRILDVRQGDGTYVTELAADTLLAALSVVVDFHGDATVLEVIQVRRILEPAATALAAMRIDADTIAEHRAIVDALERRDAELARSWATVHVAGVEEWIRDALQR